GAVNMTLMRYRIVSPPAPASPAAAPSAPYGAPAPRSPDACNTRRTGQDHNLLKTHRSSDNYSAAHVSQHTHQTPQDGRTGITACGG
ncbi:MAG: hypothetical protein ABF623_14410, partial [Gluconobacter cerinus]|uniref:hypothetical protein n=1 Tax=Gluconobacter cerinus TaxID=38307 RepID=UPI0039ED5D35